MVQCETSLDAQPLGAGLAQASRRCWSAAAVAATVDSRVDEMAEGCPANPF